MAEEIAVRHRWFNFALWRRLLRENKQRVLDQYRTEKGKPVTRQMVAYWIGSDIPPKLYALGQIARICDIEDMNRWWKPRNSSSK